MIGGSLGMAAKRRHLARHIVGVSRHAATLRQAKARGAITTGTTRLEDGVRGADLVILATPVDTIVPLAKRAAASMRAGSVLTDVGSTKGAIVAALERSLPRRISVVGGHPIAGSEACGFAAASPALFDGSTCILTRTTSTDRHTLQRVSRFWKSLGVRVIVMSPRDHDRLLANTSHLPHLLAYALAQTLEGGSTRPMPQSFLDMTRVAKSHPELWDDIFLSNRPALLAAIARFEREWRRLRTAVAQGNRQKLRQCLASAYAKRRAIKDSDAS
ncbi:MAG: prephenate dehydrogenase [Candidatus Omnitrophica bacterium]|nr:prephenate dehydrogenase [Candidatus Omnitrophota bacterium]